MHKVSEALVDGTSLLLADFEIHTGECVKMPSINELSTVFDKERRAPKEGFELNITCVLNRDYFLNAKIFPKDWDIRKRPGNSIMLEAALEEEKWTERGILDHINRWARDVHRELTSPVVARQFRAVYEELEELSSRLDSIPDEYFSEDDAKRMSERLDELERRLIAEIERAKVDSADKHQRIEDLENDLAFLRLSLETLTQRNWFRGLGNRMAKWASSPTGKAVLENLPTLIKMLPSGDK